PALRCHLGSRLRSPRPPTTKPCAEWACATASLSAWSCSRRACRACTSTPSIEPERRWRFWLRFGASSCLRLNPSAAPPKFLASARLRRPGGVAAEAGVRDPGTRRYACTTRSSLCHPFLGSGRRCREYTAALGGATLPDGDVGRNRSRRDAGARGARALGRASAFELQDEDAPARHAAANGGVGRR